MMYEMASDLRSGMTTDLTTLSPPQASAVGNLNPYPDDDSIKRARGPYKFRVSLRWNPPKLTLLSFNGQLLCSAREGDLHSMYYIIFLFNWLLFQTLAGKMRPTSIASM